MSVASPEDFRQVLARECLGRENEVLLFNTPFHGFFLSLFMNWKCNENLLILLLKISKTAKLASLAKFEI